MKAKLASFLVVIISLLWINACNIPNGNSPNSNPPDVPPNMQTATAWVMTLTKVATERSITQTAWAHEYALTQEWINKNDDGKAPAIINISASTAVLYYGDPSCSPREVEFVVTVQDDGELDRANYGYYIDGKNAIDAGLSPIARENAPILLDWPPVSPGQHTYRTTVTSKGIEGYMNFMKLTGNEHIVQFTAEFKDVYGNWSVILINEFKSKDRSGQSVATGPLFPAVRFVRCVKGPTPAPITLTPKPPVVKMPTLTPTPYIEIEPVNQPVISSFVGPVGDVSPGQYVSFDWEVIDANCGVFFEGSPVDPVSSFDFTYPSNMDAGTYAYTLTAKGGNCSAPEVVQSQWTVNIVAP